MRFHIGFSKRISWKWLLLIGGGLLAFFGIGNHVVLAANLSAVPNNVYVKSPQNDEEYAYSGDLINAETGTPYVGSWAGESYYAFQTISSPYTSIGKGQDIRGARLRWTYPTAQMNKCGNDQSITYEFEFYLRKLFSSSSVWNKGWNQKPFQKVWIRSSSQNFSCTVSDLSESTMRASCTIPNPTSNVYFYLEGFSIPVSGWYQSNGSNQYYNVGVRTISYTCSGFDAGAIINSANNNTTQIIENNNANTQQITDAIGDMQNSQEQLNDYLQDHSITNETSSSAVDIFTTDPFANHGLQSIITAPIALLQGIINANTSQCTPLAITFPFFERNVNVAIPCGDIIWGNANSNAILLYQTFVFGLFGYYILRDIFYTVSYAMDPESKNDYVMDL